MLKWTLRIGGGLLGLVLLALAIFFIAYWMWISGLRNELTKGSQVVSTSRGDVEYAILGEGEPLLFIHGMPGGYDQGLFLRRAFPEHFDGIQTIAISRPGYLRTPVASGRTPEEQADLYAALLDELKIDRVIVEGASGGAPSAVQFALRHPQRTKALILIVPLFEGWNGTGNEVPPPGSLLMQENIAVWLAGDRFARLMLPQADLSDEKQLQAARALVKTSLPRELRVDGMVADAWAFNRLDYAAWPLEQIAVPTLILQGDAERMSLPKQPSRPPRGSRTPNSTSSPAPTTSSRSPTPTKCTTASAISLPASATRTTAELCPLDRSFPGKRNTSRESRLPHHGDTRGFRQTSPPIPGEGRDPAITLKLVLT